VNVSHQMMRLITFAVLALCAVAVMSAEITSWATAKSTQESTGRVIVFRYAKEFREGFAKTNFPDRVILVWKYKSETGQPVKSEREAMDRMENLLEPLVDNAETSVLTLVSTGENLREWIFYSRSEKAFLAALNRALAGHPRFPIEVHAAPDPEWSTYGRFRKGVRD